MNKTRQNRIFLAFVLIRTGPYDTADRLVSHTYRFRPAWSGTQIASRQYTWQYSQTDGSLVGYTYPSAASDGDISYSHDALKRLSSKSLRVNGALRRVREFGCLAGERIDESELG